MQTSGQIRANVRNRFLGLGETRQKSSPLAPCDWSRECSTIFYRLNGLSRVNATEWRWNTPRAEPHGAARQVRGTPPCAKLPTRQTLTMNYAAKCPPPASGRAPLRGVGLAAWPTRWVTGGPDLLRRLENRRTWRRAAPRCEFRARHPSRKSAPRAESGGEPRVKFSAASVAGRPVARGRADV